MLADLARTGFYRKAIVKSLVAQEWRALLRAGQVAIKAQMNVQTQYAGCCPSCQTSSNLLNSLSNA